MLVITDAEETQSPFIKDIIHLVSQHKALQVYLFDTSINICVVLIVNPCVEI